MRRTNRTLRRQPDEALVVRRIVFKIALALIFVIIAAVSAVTIYLYSALQPVDESNTAKVSVRIPIGASLTEIATILESKGIISDATVFRYYTKFNNASGFMAGDYQLSPSMTLQQIMAQLKTGKLQHQEAIKMTIPEGKQLREIATIVAEKTGLDADEFMKRVDNKEYIAQLMKQYPTVLTNDILAANIKHPLEGYLFPATYSFVEKPTIEQIVEVMLNKTEEVFAKYEETRIAKKLSIHNMITMASLIEEEATAMTDRQQISSVFYNRLAINMPLQTDPTVLYALGRHKSRVLYRDLKVDSPYNTYKVKGLTPGPIANAGEISIDAALKPATTEYYYFLATATGEVLFSKTLSEHNEKKAKYITKQ